MLTNTEYILKWVEKSKTEEDNFDKFVYGFFALNAMYSNFYEGNERNAIKALFDTCFEEHRNDFVKILDMPEYEYFRDRPPIKNMKYDPSRESRWKDTSGDTKRLSEKDPKKSNRAMLMIIYQIRCNLFHGNKAFSNANDQMIMKNAAELLLQYNLIFCKCLHML